MRIYSDTLTRAELYFALPPHIDLPGLVEHSSRKRAHAYEAGLEYIGPPRKGLRRRNTGVRGADRYGYAASWDEWGVWIARLFDIDPDAIVGPYNGKQAFYDTTAKWQPRGMTAPWLAASV